MMDAKVRNILVSKTYKTAFQQYRKSAMLQEMISICAYVRSSHIQVIALAAALKEVKKEHVFPMEKRDILLRSVRISPNYS
jgi:hypothetical protein